MKPFAMQTRYETGGGGQHYILAVDLRGFRVGIRCFPAKTVNPSVVEKQMPAAHPISNVITDLTASGINERALYCLYYIISWIFLIVFPTDLFISLHLKRFFIINICSTIQLNFITSRK